MTTAARDTSKRLPVNFGKIDPAVLFDVNRYFTALRSAGANPRVVRFADGTFSIWREAGQQRSTIKKRRLAVALAWSNAQDPKLSQQHSYLNEILEQIPGGYFEYHLG